MGCATSKLRESLGLGDSSVGILGGRRGRDTVKLGGSSCTFGRGSPQAGSSPGAATATSSIVRSITPDPSLKLPASTPADTASAIIAEVARVRQLPAEECTRLGRKYTDPEALFEALNTLNGKAVCILRASWLRKQKPAVSARSRLPRRGDRLPRKATISVPELRAIQARSRAKVALPVIAISHFWRTRENPDPDGETLGIIVEALNTHWNEFEENGVTDLGVLIDWCAIYQAPHNEEQQRVFGASLKTINLWYAHKGTTVWMVTQGRDRVKGLSYWDKGWPSFEYALAMLIKVSNQSGGKDWPQVRNLGEVGGKQIELARSAPSEPLAFFEGHAYGEKAFTHGFDRDAIVAPKFRETTFEVLAGVTELNFNKLGWGDAEAEQLAMVLPLCAQLSKLTLTDNQLGPEGARMLATAVRVNTVLTLVQLDGRALPVKQLMGTEPVTWLDLSYEQLGDASAILIGKLLEVNSTLTELRLQFNNIGPNGAQALAEAVRVNKVIKSLDLYNNAVGPEGAQALAAALRVNTNLTFFNASGNDIGDAGAIAIAGALKKVSTALSELWLGGNSIGADGAQALADSLRVNTALKSLVLDGNDFGLAGATALADALRVNVAMAKLGINANSIGNEGALAIADALKTHKSMENVYLGLYNNIDKPTKKKLKEVGAVREALKFHF